MYAGKEHMVGRPEVSEELGRFIAKITDCAAFVAVIICTGAFPFQADVAVTATGSFFVHALSQVPLQHCAGFDGRRKNCRNLQSQKKM